MSPQAGEQVGALGPIELEFNQPMDAESVSAALQIQPSMSGHFTWSGNSARFFPDHPFLSGIRYTASLSPKAHSQSGVPITTPSQWSFQVRPAALMYLSPASEHGELWQVDPQNGNPIQITHTGNQVREFAASRQGQAVAYTVANPEGGSDLWVMDRQGEEQRILVACGNQRCSLPSWSADGSRLLFLCIPGSLPSYLMEYRVETDTATQLRSDPVMEAVYTDDAEQIILKTAEHARQCDMFQVWNRRREQMGDFCHPDSWKRGKPCTAEREIAVFPDHRSFLFKESPALGAGRQALPDPARQSLVVCDVWRPAPNVGTR
jgi:dipeptidyl aminopeptidase/acylaminoacyl peptidase